MGGFEKGQGFKTEPTGVVWAADVQHASGDRVDLSEVHCDGRRKGYGAHSLERGAVCLGKDGRTAEKNEMKSVPSVVSKRNHFNPAGELADDALSRLPDQFKHPEFAKWLLRYTETVIKHVASHFGVAASRGIEQAANLLCDPSYYEVKRRQRSRITKEMQERMAAQRWEKIQRRECPTAEQIEEQKRQLSEEIKYHESVIAKHEQRLVELNKMEPSNIKASRLTQ